MTKDDRHGIERAIDLCLAAREQIQDRSPSSRLRLLFDILLLELGREFAKQIKRDQS